MKWSTIRQRAYADLWMPSRIAEYRALLEAALEHGYEICSIRSFHRQLQEPPKPGKRYCVLRHDIDTGVRTAQKMWAIEQELGIRGSYYFRLKTVSIPFMLAIEHQGGEASYHFEELSTLAKQRGIRQANEVPAILPAARELFARNLANLRDRTGLRMEIVASHGDWINRRLGVQNWEILASPSFRKDVGIDLEAYDTRLMDAVLKHSDGPPPRRWLWEDRDPLQSMRSAVPAIQILIHPRHWRVERAVNIIENASRSAEELWYQLIH